VAPAQEADTGGAGWSRRRVLALGRKFLWAVAEEKSAHAAEKGSSLGPLEYEARL